MSDTFKILIPPSSLEKQPIEGIDDITQPIYCIGCFANDDKNMILTVDHLDYPVLYPKDAVFFDDEEDKQVDLTDLDTVEHSQKRQDVTPVLDAVYVNLPSGHQVTKWKLRFSDDIVLESDLVDDPRIIRETKTLFHQAASSGKIIFGEVETVNLDETNILEHAIQNVISKS